MSPATLAPSEVAEVMGVFSRSLEAHRDTINRLNVYPVPDGDTGTNMQLTMASVVKELVQLDASDSTRMEPVCRAISHGSLMGARGNSGVILCQMLRALADRFATEPDGVGGAVLADALAEADGLARKGVMRPVEGTILSVASAGAKAAAAAAEESGGDLSRVAAAARAAAATALAETPSQLAVLEQAGVVDAGGAGLLLLFDALAAAAEGTEPSGELALPRSVRENLARGAGEGARGATEGEREAGERARAAGDVGDLRYEVMYFLEAEDDLLPGFQEMWADLGDSIVVVGGDGLWNCHIHTDDVGAAIEAALDVGRPREIRVTDLRDQVEEESWVVRAEQGAAQAHAGVREGPQPVTSVIAVATGDGLRRIFHSLGVRDIVAGGQSMNPSTAEFLDMIDAVEGREVVILPNNENIHAVAAQAAEVADRSVRVVPTCGIQEGFAALLEYDPQATAEDNARAMTQAASRVVSGEVTEAVRASDTPAGHVERGDWIGLSRSGVEVIGASVSEATSLLLDRLVTGEHEIVTIIEGIAARAADTRRITEWLAEHRPGVSVDLHHGGQPLYPYLVAAE